MRKMRLFFFVFLLLVIIIFCCCTCLAETYHIAKTSLTITLPDSWFYTDKEVQASEQMCKIMNTDKETIASFFAEETIMFAYDPDYDLYISLDSEYFDQYDFSTLTDSDINFIVSPAKERFKNKGEAILSSSILYYDIPFYKLICTNGERVLYYYTTIYSEKCYTLYCLNFSTPINKQEVEKKLDDMISSITFDRTIDNDSANNTYEQSYRFDDFFLFTNSDYVYTVGDDKNKDITEQFVFNNDYHVKAMIYYDGLSATVLYYPRHYKSVLTEKECQTEIIKYANCNTSDPESIKSLGENAYFYQRFDTVGQNTIEFLDIFFFHKNGIVKIQTNHHIDTDDDHTRLVDFMINITESIFPLEEMPNN